MRRSKSVGICVVLMTFILALGACSASAETPGPGWALTATTYPTALPPGGSGVILVNVMNVGASDSNGTVTVTDTLPPGVTAEEAGDLTFLGGGGGGAIEIGHSAWDCAGGSGEPVTGASVVKCTNDPENLPSIAGGGGNPGSDPGGLTFNSNPIPQMAVRVRLPAGEASLTNRVVIVGGGALASASTSNPVTVTGDPASIPFGFEGWDVWASNADGTFDTQAGSHPYEVTFSFDLNNYFNESLGLSWSPAGAPPEIHPFTVRDVEVQLPPGFVGDPNALPMCTRQQLDATECPASSQLGIITVTDIGGTLTQIAVYNIVPPAGVPDEIGFTFGNSGEGIEAKLDTGVRSGSDYGLTTHADDVPEKGVIESVLTLWGNPGDPSHDHWRNKESFGAIGCQEVFFGTPNCPNVTGENKPFLTLPTACPINPTTHRPEPPTFTIKADTWQDPNVTAQRSVQLHDSNGNPIGFTGCEHLSFAPTIATQPDTGNADTPAGLTVEVKPSVGGLSSLEGLSSSDIQDTTVTLPEGFVVNPGQAAGLQACQFAEAHVGDGNDGPPSCPGASKIGVDEIVTPLLSKPLQGDVYILQSNPPELKLLVAASGSGVNVKLVGTVHLDEQTGRLTTTFEGTPELPFTNFKLSFSGGAQAALDTPTQCGTYTTSGNFTPWSSPFLSEFPATAAFAITAGPNSGPCSSDPMPFTPTLTAGSTTDQAGGFTNFSMLLQRDDGQQRIDGLQFKAPVGLTGELSKVPLCTNAQAESNTCPAASKIGHTVVTSGPGPYPLVVPQPGQPESSIYLTESYGGAPFGLSIVVPLHVGPFVLPTQRVRAKIDLNPLTAALTITTDPLPQVVAGVPTDLREVDAVIDRPEFMVNPTNCNPSEFSGTAYGTPPPGAGGAGATAPISSHFGVGACQALKFAPSISFSTSGKTSKSDGADLITKVTYPSAPQGTYANLGYVKVELPKALPSRLTTLQKACTDAQFEANPANCPAASKIGYATVHTPLLPVPLTGPAIFVSHGGEAFPSLTMVLQGYGVTIDLVGTTFISKSGITSTTFKAVPDQPFSSFELVLPQGPFSALAANGNLCAQQSSLKLPVQFTGQNGAPLAEDPQVSVTGCKPAITVTRHTAKGATATIAVKVPAAGKLVATAKGLAAPSGASRASKSTSSATGATLTVKLTLTNAELARLKKHPGRKLSARIHLQFIPTKGTRLTTTTTVAVG